MTEAPPTPHTRCTHIPLLSRPNRRGASAHNKIKSEAPVHPTNLVRLPPRHEQNTQERHLEMGKGKKTLAAARTDPLSRGMAVDPFDENRCCNCGTPPAGLFFAPPPSS